MDLKSACDALRAHENNEVAAIVVQDAALQRVLAVWPMVKRRKVDLHVDQAKPDDLWVAVGFNGGAGAGPSGVTCGTGRGGFRGAHERRGASPSANTCLGWRRGG